MEQGGGIRRKYKTRTSSSNYSIKNASSSGEHSLGSPDGLLEPESLAEDTLPEPMEKKRLTKAELKKMTFSNFEFDRPNPLHDIVRLSTASTHSNLSMSFDLDRLSVTNLHKGYRSCKATHGAEQGCWYYEIEVPSAATGHFRVGWSQILADVHAPVGYDEYSYSFRDLDGQAFHVSRGKPYGQKWGPGDIIGCMIDIPPVDDAMKPEAKRLLSQIQSKYPPKKEGLYKVSLEVLPNSQITFFVNGVSQGVAFSNIYNAKYYPSISIYMGGPLKVNFGPNFAFPPSNCHTYKPIFNLHEIPLNDSTPKLSQEGHPNSA